MKHFVFATKEEADSVVAYADAEMGLPRCSDPVKYPDAQAWIDGGMVGPQPPHGLTVTFDEPLEHPDGIGWSVSLPDVSIGWLENLPTPIALLDGKNVPAVGVLRAADATVRTPDWLPGREEP